MRLVIDQLKDRYSVQCLCQVLELPRSSYYARPTAPAPEPTLVAVEQVLMRGPTYGYRRVRAQLRCENIPASE